MSFEEEHGMKEKVKDAKKRSKAIEKCRKMHGVKH